MSRPRIKDERFRRITQTIRLSRYVADWIDRQEESGGKIVENALISHYNIAPPCTDLSHRLQRLSQRTK